MESVLQFPVWGVSRVCLGASDKVLEESRVRASPLRGNYYGLVALEPTQDSSVSKQSEAHRALSEVPRDRALQQSTRSGSWQ
jgi:hypothetical protein